MYVKRSYQRSSRNTNLRPSGLGDATSPLSDFPSSIADYGLLALGSFLIYALLGTHWLAKR